MKSEHFETHISALGGQVKPVRDPYVKQVVYRYRSCACRHTFRHYPERVDQAQQTQRLWRLAALA
jgi:hypothetical protein